MMIFKEIASAFRTTISGLADMIGISRQALYDCCKQEKKYRNDPKLMVVRVKALRYISIEMYVKDMEEAKKRKSLRDAKIDKLEELINSGEI